MAFGLPAPQLIPALMYLCPRCHEALIQKADANGVSWQCSACGGKAMGFGVLRKTIGPQRMAEALGQVVTSNKRDGCACPMCSLPMDTANLEVDGQEVTLDLCQSCGFVWFDTDEYELIPPAPPPPHVLGEIDPTKMSPEARERLAMIEIQEIAERSRAQDPMPVDDWKAIPAIFGLPIEMDAPEPIRIPWATYLLSLVIASVSVAAFTDLRPVIDQYGLIPAEVWRDHGLTLISSFFLHAGWVHLLGNLYFLLIFGRAVENDLGPWKWFMLVVAATLTGNFLHILGNPNSDLPCIGASGGISGLIAYYALKFPKARLGMLFRFGYVYFRWIQFSAWSAFVFWILFQIYGAWGQMAGYSSVASLAHLGGVIPGILFWWIWRNHQPPSEPSSMINPMQVKVK